MSITPQLPTYPPKASSTKEDKKKTALGAILYRLTEPTASIHEPERRRSARLLSALLATQFLLSLLVTFLILRFTDYRPSDLYTVVAATVILLFTYVLSRTNKYNLAALIEIGTLSGAVFITEAMKPDPSSLYFLILGVLVSSLFLSRRMTVIIMALTIFGIVLLSWAFSPTLPVRDAIGAMFAVLCVGALGIVATTIRQEDQQELQLQSVSLRQAEDRFQLISYATNDVVWDWDLLTNKVWRNQGVQRLFGFSEDQVSAVIGWWEKQIHPDDREKIIKSLRDAIDSGETFWSNEYRFQRADSSYSYIFDRAYIIHDEKSGQPVRAIGAMMDITARKQAEEILRQESVHDPLTGLFNRRYMEEMLDREINRAERTPQQISIIMLDIDHFKQINDTLGHAAGDTLLHSLGLLLLSQVRGTDIACRYGGDEFILILPGATQEIAQQRAEKIRENAKGLMAESYSHLLKDFTLSLGVAVFPEQGTTRKAIFAAADSALYTAKAAGRNQVALAK